MKTDLLPPEFSGRGLQTKLFMYCLRCTNGLPSGGPAPRALSHFSSPAPLIPLYDRVPVAEYPWKCFGAHLLARCFRAVAMAGEWGSTICLVGQRRVVVSPTRGFEYSSAEPVTGADWATVPRCERLSLKKARRKESEAAVDISSQLWATKRWLC